MTHLRIRAGVLGLLPAALLLWATLATGLAQGPPQISFRGTIVAMNPDPNVWSGVLEIYQKVTYEVDAVLSGTLVERRIDVYHLIDDFTNPDLDPNRGAFLRKDLFAVGKTVVVTGR